MSDLPKPPAPENEIPLQVRMAGIQLGDGRAKFVYTSDDAVRQGILTALRADGAVTTPMGVPVPEKPDDIRFDRDEGVLLGDITWGFTGISVEKILDGRYILSLKKWDESGWSGPDQYRRYTEILDAPPLVLPVAFDAEIDTDVKGLEYLDNLGVTISEEDFVNAAQARRSQLARMDPPDQIVFTQGRGQLGALSVKVDLPVDDPRLQATATVFAEGEYTDVDRAFRPTSISKTSFPIEVRQREEYRYSTDHTLQNSIFETASRLAFRDPGYVSQRLGIAPVPQVVRSRFHELIRHLPGMKR